MRIVCQKCSAAYAIDDKLVTPKGIRAQCPRCRHLQLVKSDQPAVTEPAVPAPFSISGPPPPLPSAAAAQPAAAPAGGDADLFFDFSGPPPPPGPSGNSKPTTPGFAPPPPAPPPPAPAPPAFDAGGDMLDFSDLGGPPPEPATSPRALAPLPSALKKGPSPSAPKPMPPAAPAAASPMPQSSAPFDFSGDFSFGEPPPGPAAPLHKQGTSPGLRLKPKEDSQPPPPPPSKPPSSPAAGPGALAAPQVKCKSCGKVLTDPFDQALGICDDCRNAQPSGISGLSSPGEASGRAKSSSGVSKAAAPPASNGFSADAGPALETAEPEKKQVRPSQPRRAVATAYREGEEPQGGSGKVVAMAVLLLAVFGAGGAYLFIKKPWVKKPPPLAQKLPISSARPIDAMVDRWRAQYPELTGSAAEHAAAGEEKLALDTSSAYAEAEREFQKALVLDKSNDRAVAGWALALAFGRGDKVDGDTQKMAEQMLVAAEQRGGDARVYVAHAHLLLVRSANLNDIQILAERGTQSPSDKDKALAYLALGQAYLNKNPKSAEDNFAKAVKADPKLKRAYLYQVRFMVSQGEYRAAVQALEKRLQDDPDQFEAADLLAKLYLDVGEPALAKKTYQRAAQAAPSSGRPKLALAVLAYQHEGDLGAAASLLDGLAARKDENDRSLQVEALGHRAAVARLQGDAQGAMASADAAIALRSDDPNAHVQKLFASLAAGNAAEARAQLQHLKLGEPGLEAAFEARVLMGEGKFGDAFDKLKKAVELDPRRTDATLLAGAAAVKAKNEPKGWEWVLAKGYKADPLQSGPRSPMAPVFISRSDFLAPARGTFAPLAKDKEDPNPSLAEGLIAWHLGDLTAADAAFVKVISADPTNAQALAYRALVALRRKDAVNGGKHAAKAVASDRTSGVAHLAMGWSLLMTNKAEAARKSLQKAVELAPNLFLARAKLAEADIKVRKVAEAKAAMTQVLLSDPTYAEAKRVLYGVP